MNTPTVQNDTRDKSRSRSASTEQTRLYYVRCLGDGSWLGEPMDAGKFYMRGGFPRDVDVARVTRDDAQVAGLADGPYRLIPIDVPIWQHIRDLLTSSGSASLTLIMEWLKTKSPYPFSYAEIAVLLTEQIRSGNIEVAPDSTFKWSGAAQEPKPPTLAEAMKQANDVLALDTQAPRAEFAEALATLVQAVALNVPAPSGEEVHLADDLVAAIADARKAMRGDSNDAEHDALFALVEMLDHNDVAQMIRFYFAQRGPQ
jgi:hypothetical protein